MHPFAQTLLNLEKHHALSFSLMIRRTPRTAWPSSAAGLVNAGLDEASALELYESFPNDQKTRFLLSQCFCAACCRLAGIAHPDEAALKRYLKTQRRRAADPELLEKIERHADAAARRAFRAHPVDPRSGQLAALKLCFDLGFGRAYFEGDEAA